MQVTYCYKFPSWVQNLASFFSHQRFTVWFDVYFTVKIRSLKLHRQKQEFENSFSSQKSYKLPGELNWKPGCHQDNIGTRSLTTVKVEPTCRLVSSKALVLIKRKAGTQDDIELWAWMVRKRRRMLSSFSIHVGHRQFCWHQFRFATVFSAIFLHTWERISYSNKI